ncbi:MAG TPA: YgiQ family radical SAM protein, partial [Rubrivivax sp.]|nr:YgiQ family radical SAM protein [Rubrivivax sp.]
DGAVAGPAEAVVALPLSRRGAGASSSMPRPPRDRSVIRLPSYEQVRADPVLYAHASRVMHLETNPGNARALVQRHGERDVWVNPPPVPLTTPEMDHVFGLPYARSPHPRYADDRGRHDGPTKISAWEMIRFSVNIMRGCFGGCSFCSITEHEGRIIQSRSEASVLREIEDMRDKVQGFTGVVSDLGGPTANMYRLGCRSREIEAACRKPSCVWPGICANLRTDHAPLVQLYRHARALPGVRKVLIASGLRYDLAVQSPEYVRELVEHHVGGYLKIAPEHTEAGPLARMMKPGIGSYDRFRAMFEAASAAAGKQQYLIPYFIAAHPGTTDEDMLQLALWLKRNGFKADQVQAFYPTPLSSATAMYHTGIDTLHGVHRDARGRHVDVARGERRRRLHKAFLRWHDADNWPLLREALHAMGRDDLIGSGRDQLVPRHQPASWASGCKTRGGAAGAERPGPRDGRRAGAGDAAPASVSPGKRPGAAPRRGTLLTQHTGLPPRAGGGRGRR